MDFRLLDLIATVIDFCTPPTEQGRGHPRSATVRVLATLRQFLREGTPWRSLKATADKVSGSTLRRHLEQWAGIGVLAQVHAVLVGMLRGDPTLILDTCSVRVRRGGDLIRPNSTDPGKRDMTLPSGPSSKRRGGATGNFRGSSLQCFRLVGSLTSRFTVTAAGDREARPNQRRRTRLKRLVHR